VKQLGASTGSILSLCGPFIVEFSQSAFLLTELPGEQARQRFPTPSCGHTGSKPTRFLLFFSLFPSFAEKMILGSSLGFPCDLFLAI
jgi:hypothetical protein